MSKSEQIQAELKKLLPQIKKIVGMIEDTEQNWPEHYNSGDPEAMYQRMVNYRVAYKLAILFGCSNEHSLKLLMKVA